MQCHSGHAKVVDAREEPDYVARLAPPGGHGAAVERIFLIDVVSYDWNCPKFITPHFTEGQVEEAVAPLRTRLAALEKELDAFRA